MNVLIFSDKATKAEIGKVSSIFRGISRLLLILKIEYYVQVLIDMLMRSRNFKLGSKQSNLWGGGIDIETGEIDYNSMVNIRPNQDNPSRDIMSMEIRKTFDEIVTKILK